MLINCPKCGFSQPKDQYCAKCGVDIDGFKPQQPTLATRMLTHPAFHITVVFICVFLAVSYIRSHRKKSFVEQLQSFPQENRGTAVLDRSNIKASEPPPPAATPTSLPSTPTTSASPAQHNSKQASNSDTTSVPAAGLMPINEGGRTGDSKSDKKIALKIIYAEVDEITLKRWAPEMQSSGFYSETGWSMGMLPNIEKRISEDRSIITLESVEKKLDLQHMSAEWITGKQSENTTVGFSGGLALALEEGDAHSNSLKGNIKIQRNLDGAEPRLLETDFELPRKAGLVFWRVLNPKMQIPSDFVADTGSFFQIYHSARFKSQRSDFTIFVVLDTPSKP